MPGRQLQCIEWNLKNNETTYVIYPRGKRKIVCEWHLDRVPCNLEMSYLQCWSFTNCLLSWKWKMNSSMRIILLLFGSSANCILNRSSDVPNGTKVNFLIQCLRIILVQYISPISISWSEEGTDLLHSPI